MTGVRMALQKLGLILTRQAVLQHIRPLSQHKAILRKTHVVTKVQDCRCIVDDLLQAGQPVGLDAEGVNLGMPGVVTLLQVGNAAGDLFIFDVLAGGPNMLHGGRLADLLRSETVTKVIHSCRNDAVALHYRHGVTLCNVFDTQVAHSIVTAHKTGVPLRQVPQISYNDLCRLYGEPVNPVKDRVKQVYKWDFRYWARRPLTNEMIVYAAADIVALVPTLHDALEAEVPPEQRSPMEDQVLATIRFDDDGDASSIVRKKEADAALVKKRLDAATESDCIALTNREVRLIKYMNLSDEERDKLIRVSPRAAKYFGVSEEDSSSAANNDTGIDVR